MRFKNVLAIASFSALAFTSCHVPEETVYFRDSFANSLENVVKEEKIKFMPGDKVFIIVNSKDVSLMNLFNLNLPNNMTRQAIASSATYALNNNYGMSYYIVDSKGNIEFPILGTIHVEGMTREELAEKIQYDLRSQDHVKDAVVTVEYLDMSVSVMGEVTKPGKYPINRDRLTIIDALSNAGDITMYGLKDRVKVFRKSDDGKMQTYQVNMMYADSTFNSPVYYLQQDDIVYVEPNDTKRRQGTASGSTMFTPSFWVSAMSLAVSICVLLFK